MMKSVFSFLLLLMAYNIQAQNACDTIRVEQELGKVYLYQGKKLKPKHMLAIMEPNPAAYSEMKIAKTNYDVGSVFAFAGGFLMGWSLGAVIGGGQMDWRIAGAGAGLVGLSIPFSIGQASHTRKAVRLFNTTAKSGTCSINFKMNCSINQLGIVANF